MSQSIVPFATTQYINGLPQPALSPISNVFDTEISVASQAYYTSLMTPLQTFFNTTTLTAADYNSATPDVQTKIQDFAKELSALNIWAQMKTVNSAGKQINTYNITDSSITTLPQDATNPDGTPVSASNTNNSFDPYVASLNPTTGQHSLDPAIQYSASLTTSMSSGMAQALEKVDNLLSAAGYIPGNLPSLYTALKTMQGNVTGASAPVDIYQFGAALQSALNAANVAQLIGFAAASTKYSSIQQVLMVDYIQTGNNVLFAQMSQVKAALDANNKILGYLNALQDLMNQKDPQQFVQQLQDLSTTTGTLTDAQYSKFETDTFAGTLGTVADFSDSPVMPVPVPVTIPQVIPLTNPGLAAVDPFTGATESTVYLTSDTIPPGFAPGQTIPFFDPLSTTTPKAVSMRLGIADAATDPNTGLPESTTYLSTDTIPNATNPTTGRPYAIGDTIPLYVPGTSTFSTRNGVQIYTTQLNPVYQQTETNLATYASSLTGSGGAPLFSQAFATSAGSYAYSKATIINSIQTLLGTTQNSRLIQSLKSLITDLNTTTGGGGSITAWIQDIQANNAYGGFQQSLSNAVTASQSFNDTQQATLQSVMFIFQEFYQSASSVLSDMNTQLLKIADNIH